MICDNFRFFEKALEQCLGLLPIFPVHAVAHPWWFDGALNQASVLQLLEVLRDGGLRHGQLVHDIAHEATGLAFEELQDEQPRRVSKRLGVASEPLLLFGVRHDGGHCFIVYRKSTMGGRGGR